MKKENRCALIRFVMLPETIRFARGFFFCHFKISSKIKSKDQNIKANEMWRIRDYKRLFTKRSFAIWLDFFFAHSFMCMCLELKFNYLKTCAFPIFCRAIKSRTLNGDKNSVHSSEFAVLNHKHTLSLAKRIDALLRFSYENWTTMCGW